MKSSWKIGLIMVLCLAMFVVLPNAIAQQEVKRPNTFIKADIGVRPTLDPSWFYDTAANEIILNIYEGLIFYKPGKVDEFQPMLATVVPSIDNGLITKAQDGSVYITFPLRKGVTFHNGNKFTAEDVVYSFKRLMVMERSGGPANMIIKPLLGVSSLSKLKEQGLSDQEICEKMDEAIYADNEYQVTFHLPKAYGPFMGIIGGGGNWGMIMDKDWAVEQGAWPGTCDNWRDYHQPDTGIVKEESPLYDVTNGTGPFKLENWDKANKVVTLTRNENYWREPAKLEKLQFKVIDEYSTRRLLLKNGEVDYATIDPQYLESMRGLEGVEMVTGLPGTQNASLFFNYDINPKAGNQDIGSGKLDGNGIPTDFFSDVHIRKAFAYSVEWDAMLEEIWQGQGAISHGPIVKGVRYWNPDQENYHHDLEKAEEHLKKAWDGKAWENGFKVTINYNTGNMTRKSVAEMVERNLESLNPKIDIIVQAVDWATYLDRIWSTKDMSAFIIGWIEDYHDAHNWVNAYLQSEVGAFAAYTGKPDKYNELIDKGVYSQDPKERQEVYYQLQKMAIEDGADLYLVDGTNEEYYRTWLKGYVYNPGLGTGMLYCYPMYKEAG